MLLPLPLGATGAAASLQDYDVVGFTELFNESLLRLADTSGFEHILYVKRRGARLFGMPRVNVRGYSMSGGACSERHMPSLAARMPGSAEVAPRCYCYHYR